ncbi:MAG: efflux RND transporter periplasmic adaptor subunit [Bacillota bacterium]|jgi:multidrug efflux pump subunit AcrA (membrane-fusion protein)
MKHKGMYLLIIAIIIATIAAVVVRGFGFEKNKKEVIGEQPVTVSTAAVTQTTMERVISVNGKVKPVSEAEVSAKVSGKVSQIFFVLGQTVKKGDVLFKLDDRDLRLEMELGEAALKVTRTSLDSSLITAETKYQEAKRNYERLKRLYEKQIGSRQELESAETAYIQAEDFYKSAKLAAQDGTTNARAQLERARLAYENAKTQLEYTVVRAPIDGIIATKDLKVGQYVGASTTVATLVDLSSVEVETYVSEAIINSLRRGDQAEIHVKSVSAEPLTGRITALAPAVDVKSLNYPVNIEVANPKGLLKSGMFADVKFTVERNKQVMAVALDAIVEEDQRKYVWLLAGDKARKRLIKTGIIDTRLAQVTEGLTAKDVVIVKGVNLLKNGAKVMVVK